MALNLSTGASFRKNDAVEIAFNSTSINATVVYSGEGYMSPYEDMFYLMSAPHQGIEDLFSEESEIKSAFVLVSMKSRSVPFTVLPCPVDLKTSKGASVRMNVLAIICGKPRKEEYLVFLEA